MAKTNPTLGPNSGKIGELVYYTRFGKEFVRRKAETFNDCKSEAQLRQRALFKATQQTAALYGTMLQRGLTKYAHSQGHTEANEFSRLNKECFTYAAGKVTIDYPALQLAVGPLPTVAFTACHADGLHITLTFDSILSADKARPDDVVHIYAVSPQAEVCMLMASVERQSGQAAFDLPDLSDELASEHKTEPTNKRKNQTNALTHSRTNAINYHLYAIVEAANTAPIPTLSADEKKANKLHRNINRRVSNSIFVGTVTTTKSQA